MEIIDYGDLYYGDLIQRPYIIKYIDNIKSLVGHHYISLQN